MLRLTAAYSWRYSALVRRLFFCSERTLVKARSLLLVAGLILASGNFSSGQVVTPTNMVMEIVNDTTNSDSQVFILLSGTDVLGMTGPMTAGVVDFATIGTNTVSCIPLSSLDTNGTVLVSALTGQPRNIYTFSCTNAASARLFISYSPDLKFVGATAPTNVEGYRFDKMEISYDGNSWSGDLTSVDFLGVPMQIDAIAPDGSIIDTRSFYFSRQSIVNSIPFPKGSKGAVQYDTNGNFARLLSPQTMAGSNTVSGSVKPYPSFVPYLKQLDAAPGINFVTSGFAAVGNQPLLTWINDQTNSIPVPIPQNGGNYNFKGVINSDGKNGYTIKLTGSVTNWQVSTVPAAGPPAPITNATQIIINLPAGQLEEVAYGCVLNQSSFTVIPKLAYPAANCTTTNAQASYYNAVYGNSIYSWIVGNVQAGLNYGYLGSRWGNSTTNWFYTRLPPPGPFGTARTINDGFYNPYAAAIYNASDSYGFALSDRGLTGINPLISYPATNANPRVTILPDNQLDAPVNVRYQNAKTLSRTSNSISMTWDPVKNAPTNFTLSYLIDAYPPMPGGTVTATGLKATLTNLMSGMPYLIYVRAMAVSQDLSQTNTSLAVPYQLKTAGNFVMQPSVTDTAPGAYTFNLNCSAWAIGIFPDPTQAKITIAGQGTSYSTNGGGQFANAVVTGVQGDNYYPIMIRYTTNSHHHVYENAFKVTISTNGLATNVNGIITNFFVVQQPTLPFVTQPLSIAPPVPADLSFPQGPFNGVTGNLVIGTAGEPQTFKQLSPIVFPGKKPAPPPAKFRYNFDKYGLGP